MVTVLEWIDVFAELVTFLWLLALYILFIANCSETTFLYLTVAGISSVAVRNLLWIAHGMLPDADAHAGEKKLDKV